MESDAFPARLREVIYRSGLSQTKFAILIGFELQKLKDVLRGQVRPSLDLIQRVVGATGVESDWLLLGRIGDAGELSPTEQLLIDDFRALPSTDRAFVKRLVELMAQDDLAKRLSKNGGLPAEFFASGGKP